VSGTLGGTNVLGKGQIAGLRLLVPLKGTEGFNENLSIGTDYKSFDQFLTLSGQGNRVPLTYYPVTIAYDASWTGTKSHTELTASVVTASISAWAAAIRSSRRNAATVSSSPSTGQPSG